MRFVLLLVISFYSLLVSAQSIFELEQQLRDGVAAYQNLDLEKSERILLRLTRQIDEKRFSVQAAKTWCFLGECQYELDKDDFSQSFERADRILTAYKVNTDTLDFYYRILQFKAVVAPGDQKVASYQRVADWIARFPEPGLRIRGFGLYARGMANYYRGNYDQSFKDMKESLEVQKPLGRDPFLAYDHSVLASMAAGFQDYYLAVTHQKITVQLISTKRPVTYFRNLINLAGYQLDNRSLADARQTIDRAMLFGQENIAADSEYWMMFYNHQREYFNTILNLDSLVYYQRVAETFYQLYPNYQSTRFYHDHLNYATGIAIRLNDFTAAETSVDLTQQLFPAAVSDYDRVLSTLFLRSKVDIANNRFAEGVNLIQLLLANKRTTSQPIPGPHYVFQSGELLAEPLVIEYLKDKASYYNQWDRIDTTGNWLDRGLESICSADSLIQVLKQQNNQPGLRKQLDEISRELRKIEVENYYRQFRRTGETHFIELAVNSSEQVKHLIISERLHENILNKSYGLPEGLIRKERAYSKQLADDLLRINRGGQIDSLDQLQERITETRNLQEELRKEIATNYPRFAALRFSPEPLSLEKIRREFIAEDEVMLHFLERDSLLYLIGISKDEQLFRRIRLSAPLAETSPVLIRQMETKVDSVMPLLRSHYREILEPLEEFMGDKHLVIVPDAYLWHLPFPALITKDASAGTLSSGQAYLIQRREIRHLFSLQVGLLRNSTNVNDATASRDVLSLSPFSDGIIGGFASLPSSRETEKFLEKTIGNENGDYLSGAEANRAAFLSLATSVRLLHIFAHAEVDEERPDNSFVMLNPASGQLADGELTALDVYNTRLSAELAVLAACKTAGGKYDQGQGIANLARAFAHAGCKNLVVNLWGSQEEAISQLLSSFYPGVLKNNQFGSTALAEAQRMYIVEKPYTAHPGFWGMTIYIGGRDELKGLNNTSKHWSWVIVGALLLLLLLIFASMKFKKAI